MVVQFEKQRISLDDWKIRLSNRLLYGLCCIVLMYSSHSFASGEVVSEEREFYVTVKDWVARCPGFDSFEELFRTNPEFYAANAFFDSHAVVQEISPDIIELCWSDAPVEIIHISDIGLIQLSTIFSIYRIGYLTRENGHYPRFIAVDLVPTGNSRCPAGATYNELGQCEKTCECNERYEASTNTCDPLPASTSYDPTTDSILKFELNNHGKSCDAINAGNTVGSCEANKQTASASVGNNATTGGNPIDCATGQKTQTDVDYVGAGLDPITVVRNYSTPMPPKPMSIAWSENHGWQAGMEPIVKLPAFNDDAIWQFHNVPRMRTKVFDDGAVLKQFQLGNGLTRAFFKGANDSDYQTSIVLRPAGYNAANNEHTVTLDSGEQYVFDANGLAKYKTNAQGTPIYFYEHSGTNLAKISNRFGRFVSFDYDPAGRVNSITDQDGVQIRYGYDGDNLTQVIYPDNTPTDMSDNPTKHYVYDDANFSKYLTGIINGNGERYATFAYNDQGQAISTEHHNGAERVEVSYPEDGKAVVKFYRDTAANAYREEHYQYGKFRGRYRLTQKQITQCDNCELTTESWLYNDRELLTRHTSPEGIVTEYGYDTQDRKVSATHGAGTPEASTTTYTWNDTHNQIETITTATDVTTYTFDSEGRRVNASTVPKNIGN